ncbi:hypothetical protein BDR07DRAFT_1422837, partial [Suillus spraguei]
MNAPEVIGNSETSRELLDRGDESNFAENTIRHFQSILDQCPVSYPNRAVALNVAWACLEGYIQTILKSLPPSLLTSVKPFHW